MFDFLAAFNDDADRQCVINLLTQVPLKLADIAGIATDNVELRVYDNWEFDALAAFLAKSHLYLTIFTLLKKTSQAAVKAPSIGFTEQSLF